MQIKVFLNASGEWPTPWMEQLPSEAVDATEDTTLDEIARLAIAHSDESFEPTWIWALTMPDSQGRQQMGYLPAIIDDEGILRWLSEGLGEVTLRELRRTYEAGLFDGDPSAVCAEHMLGGNGIFPGWEDLLQWFVSAAGAGAVGIMFKKIAQVVRRHHKQWQQRGASPYAFIDVVLARKDWKQGDLVTLLQITREEAHDLLDSLGYDLDPITKLYVQSPDETRGRLRTRIIEDFLGRQPLSDDQDDDR